MTTLLITAKQNHLIPRETELQTGSFTPYSRRSDCGDAPGGLTPYSLLCRGYARLFLRFQYTKGQGKFYLYILH